MTSFSRNNVDSSPPSSEVHSFAYGQQPRGSQAGSDVAVVSQHVGSRVAGGDRAGDSQVAPASEKGWLRRTRDRLRGRTVPRRTVKWAAKALVATGAAGSTATAVTVAAGKGAALGAALGSSIPVFGTVGGALIGGVVGAVLASGAIGFFVAGGRSRDKAEQMIDHMQGAGEIDARQANRLKGLSNDQLGTLYQLEDGDLGIDDADEREARREAIRKTLLLTAAASGHQEAQALRTALLRKYFLGDSVQRGHQMIDLSRPHSLNANVVTGTLTGWAVQDLQKDPAYSMIEPLLSEQDKTRIVGMTERLPRLLGKANRRVPQAYRQNARAAILLQAARRDERAAERLLGDLREEHVVELSRNVAAYTARQRNRKDFDVLADQHERFGIHVHGYAYLNTAWTRGERRDPDGPWAVIDRGDEYSFEPSSPAVRFALWNKVKALSRNELDRRQLMTILDHFEHRLSTTEPSDRYAGLADLLDQLAPRIAALRQNLPPDAADEQLVIGVSNTLGKGFYALPAALRDILNEPAQAERARVHQDTATLMQGITGIDPRSRVGAEVVRRLDSYDSWNTRGRALLGSITWAPNDDRLRNVARELLALDRDRPNRVVSAAPSAAPSARTSQVGGWITEDLSSTDQNESDAPVAGQKAPKARVTFGAHVTGKEIKNPDLPTLANQATESYTGADLIALRLSCLMMRFALATDEQVRSGANSVEAARQATLADANTYAQHSIETLQGILKDLDRGMLERDATTSMLKRVANIEPESVVAGKVALRLNSVPEDRVQANPGRARRSGWAARRRRISRFLKLKAATRDDLRPLRHAARRLQQVPRQPPISAQQQLSLQELRLSCLMLRFGLEIDAQLAGEQPSVNAAATATANAARQYQGQTAEQLETTLQGLVEEARAVDTARLDAAIRALEERHSVVAGSAGQATRTDTTSTQQRSVRGRRGTGWVRPQPPPSQGDGNAFTRAQAQGADDEKDEAERERQ